MKIACIGAGLVGSSWASVFARAGHSVVLFDSGPAEIVARAKANIDSTLALLAKNDFLRDDIDTIKARIGFADSLAQSLADVDYIQESVREDIDIKRALYSELETLMRPNCILASSTSALKGSDIFSAFARRDHALVVHPVNPPALIPLVELCASPWTKPDLVAEVEALMTSLDMKPIVLNKEIDGFILNRLQYTLVAEAMHLVGEGYCSAEDIDRAMTDGLALRWASVGPFQVAHLNSTGGFKGFVEQLGPMMKTMGAEARTNYDWDQTLADSIHAEMAKTVPVSDIPSRQTWRDQQILTTRLQQKNS